jgi:predicted transcriptional regulator of viral defense system
MNQEPGDPDVITVPPSPRFLAVSERDRVMKAVRGIGAASIEQIQSNTGMSHHRVVTVSAELTKAGRLERTGRGRCIRYQVQEVTP